MAVHIDLTMYGPGSAPAHSLARKVKRDSKNFRLNGEFIDGPLDNPTRYDNVAPGDFVLIEFSGSGTPTAATAQIVAAANPVDAALHSALQAMLPRPGDSMRVLTEDDLGVAIAAAAPPADHPIRSWLDGEVLEDVGLGGSATIERLNARRSGRGISGAALKAAKTSAELIGQLGEDLLNQFLDAGGLLEVALHEWTAQSNAISPFDFRLFDSNGHERHADAKSTSGAFSRSIYMSRAEIDEAVIGGVPYDLFRLYNVQEGSATLRVARDVGPRLAPILKLLGGLPAGATAESLSFVPDFFSFEPAVSVITMANESEDAV